MKHETLVIMSPEFEMLGEMNLNGSACGQLNLNREGEALLGAHVADWQTRGVSAQDPTLIKFEGGVGQVFCDERVAMSSDDFADAFRQWLDDHGFAHLTLPTGALLAFCEIQKMPVDPQKKYELALMLRDLPVHKLTN
ncbi:MAG: hypothetical protein PHC70_03740 [Patescibacteria group bacterium]|nr:hypothetical protein [Patescibacteria group bacterium]